MRALLPVPVVLLALVAPAAGAQEPDIPCTVPLPAAAPAPDAEILATRELTHSFATGHGVRVAVIDTGVAPHEQLLPVIPGGDVVTPGAPDPLLDCDGHGTAVAGVIASRDLGVAPGAEIISVRQTSEHYRREEDDPSGSLASLTDAIHIALDHDADVINLSVVACVPSHVAPRVDLRDLERALARAETDDVVVVAATGNENGQCLPGDVVYPAHLPTVVAVGALADSHSVAEYSLPVPPERTHLAAAGSVPVALGVTGWASGLLAADADPVRDGARGFEGTSFATPVVSGTAALLRERYPHDTAADLRARLDAAAQPHHGAVEPYAVVTHLPGEESRPARELRITAAVPERGTGHRRAALVLSGALAALVAAAGVGGLAARTSPGPASRRRRSRSTPGRPSPRTTSPAP